MKRLDLRGDSPKGLKLDPVTVEVQGFQGLVNGYGSALGRAGRKTGRGAFEKPVQVFIRELFKQQFEVNCLPPTPVSNRLPGQAKESANGRIPL